MTPERDAELCERYPTIFRDRHGDPQVTCMGWGLACGDGWYDIIDRLCTRLQAIAEAGGGQIIADQVKEKYGTLRFYWHSVDLSDPWPEVAMCCVDVAERASAQTCERCGQAGELRPGGWLVTRCDACEEAGQ